jgi:hypothetical protein
MSHLTDLALKCAVTCAKSDNMRASASKLVCDAVAYLKTSDGVMEAHEAGVAPNMAGFWRLVTTAETVAVDRETGIETRTPALPTAFAGSFRTFQRLLQIKGDPDVDATLRREQATADKARRAAAANSINSLEDELLQTTPDAGADCNSTWIKCNSVEAWISIYSDWPKRQQKRARELFFAMINGGSAA